MAFIFQDFNLLLELTVLENVILPLQIQKINKKIAKQKSLEMLKYLGIELKANSKIDKISGRQIQRVAIARALVSGANFILQMTQKQIFRNLQSYNFSPSFRANDIKIF